MLPNTPDTLKEISLEDMEMARDKREEIVTSEETGNATSVLHPISPSNENYRISRMIVQEEVDIHIDRAVGLAEIATIAYRRVQEDLRNFLNYAGIVETATVANITDSLSHNENIRAIKKSELEARKAQHKTISYWGYFCLAISFLASALASSLQILSLTYEGRTDFIWISASVGFLSMFTTPVAGILLRTAQKIDISAEKAEQELAGSSIVPENHLETLMRLNESESWQKMLADRRKAEQAPRIDQVNYPTTLRHKPSGGRFANTVERVIQQNIKAKSAITEDGKTESESRELEDKTWRNAANEHSPSRPL